MEIKSSARFVKVAPDKIRVLGNLLKGRTIDAAISQLQFTYKVGSKPLILVLKQVKQQIKDQDKEVIQFKVKSLQVDEGPKLKRRRIIHQGRSTAILKRMSHITITLKDNESSKSKITSSKPIQQAQDKQIKSPKIEKPKTKTVRSKNGS